MKLTQKVTAELSVQDVQEAVALWVAGNVSMDVPANKVILTSEGARVTFEAVDSSMTRSNDTPETSHIMADLSPSQSEKLQTESPQHDVNKNDESTSSSENVIFEAGITPIPSETTPLPEEENSGDMTLPDGEPINKQSIFV